MDRIALCRQRWDRHISLVIRRTCERYWTRRFKRSLEIWRAEIFHKFNKFIWLQNMRCTQFRNNEIRSSALRLFTSLFMLYKTCRRNSGTDCSGRNWLTKRNNLTLNCQIGSCKSTGKLQKWVQTKNKCYAVIQTSKDFYDAFHTCHANGAKLLTLETREENKFVIDNLSPQSLTGNIWLGLYSHKTEVKNCIHHNCTREPEEFGQWKWDWNGREDNTKYYHHFATGQKVFEFRKDTVIMRYDHKLF